MKKYSDLYSALLILIVFLFCPCFSIGQDLQEEPVSAAEGLVSSISSDLRAVATSPYYLATRQPEQLLAVAGVSLGLIHFGDTYFDQFYGIEDQRFMPENAMVESGRFYDKIGPSNFVFGLTGAGLAGGFIFQDQKLLTTSRLMLESILITKGVTGLGKMIFGRSRPYAGNGANHFNIMEGHESHALRSMPSLHTSNIFAAMTVIAKQYDHLAVDIGAYGFATSVALQRTASRSHWLSDVFIGGAIGYFIGNTLVRNNQSQPSDKVRLDPIVQGNKVGFYVHF